MATAKKPTRATTPDDEDTLSPGNVRSFTAAQQRKRRGDTENGRPASIKFDAVDHTCLEALAWCDRLTVTEVIRTAMTDYFRRRITSPELSKEIKAAQAREATRQEAMLGVLKAVDASDMAMPTTAGKAERQERPTKPVTIRLNTHFINKLTAYALVDDNTMADQVRRAVDEHLARVLTIDREEFARRFNTSQGELAEVIISRPAATDTTTGRRAARSGSSA